MDQNRPDNTYAQGYMDQRSNAYRDIRSSVLMGGQPRVGPFESRSFV